MNLADLRELLTYHRWANETMLASLEGLTPEQWSRDLGCSFPTILATVTHMATAEWVWLSRWKGVTPKALPDWAAGPTPDGTIAKLRELEAERSAFVASLTDEDLARPWAYTTLTGAPDAHPLAVQIQHVVNHGTYHRGQIAAMVRQVGATPASTDLIRWAREK